MQQKNFFRASQLIACLLVTLVGFGAEGALAAPGLRESAPTLFEARPLAADFETYRLGKKAEVDLEDEIEDEPERVKKIASILELLKGNVEPLEKYRLYRTLVDLYEARSRFLRARAEAAYRKATLDLPRSDLERADLVLLYADAEKELIKSLDPLRFLVNEFPRESEAEQNLAHLIRNLARTGNDNTEFYLKTFLRAYPSSSELQATYVAIGEYYFALNDFAKADDFLRKAKDAKKGSDLYPYIVYRLGWLSYAQGQATEPAKRAELMTKAEAGFKLAALLAEKADRDGPFDLTVEARFDLLWLWAELGKTKEAEEFIAKTEDKQLAALFREKLADHYRATKKYGDALKIYRDLLQASPDCYCAPNLQVKIIETLAESGQDKTVLPELDKYFALYVKHDAAWLKVYEDRQGLANVTMARAEPLTRSLSQFYVDRTSKNPSPAVAEVTEGVQSLYLQKYGKCDDAMTVRFNRGSLYFTTGKYELARNEFRAIVAARPKDQGTLRDAAYNVILASEKIDTAAKHPEPPTPGGLAKPIIIPETKMALLDAIDSFLKLIPGDETALGLRTAAAQIYYAYGHYDTAFARFEALGYDFPETEEGRAAIESILAFYLDRENWPELIARSERYLHEPKLAPMKLKKKLREALEYAKAQSGAEN